jgi:hypothetical protein
LKKDKKGESSKDGATLQEREDEQARLDYLQEMADEQARLDSLQESEYEQARLDSLQQSENEQARLDSLQKHEQGESSKEGASLEQSESTETKKEDNTELSVDHYKKVSDMRREMAQEFNDITMKLNSKENNLSQEEREHLLNASLQLRSDVTNYDNYIQHLREVLNIQPEEGCSSQDNSSEEYSSEYSSDEESRPTKRPKK